MSYRDDRLATRARVDELERELAETKQALASARAGGAPAQGGLAEKPWLVWGVLGVGLALFVAAYAVGLDRRETGPLGLALAGAGLLVLTAAWALFVVTRLLVVVQPNQLAVVSGRRSVLPDGTSVGYRLIREGRVLRLPLLEVVDFLDLTHMVVPVTVSGCHAKGGLTLDVDAVANVKIAGELPLAAQAVERFLGVDRAAIASVAAQVLEGKLRGVVAVCEPDELLAHPRALEDPVLEEVEHELAKLGLVVDTLEVESVRAQ